MLKRRKNLLLIITVFFVIITATLSVAHFVLAADPDVAGISYGAQTGLGSADPRIVVAKVIRVALGFLGIIAVSLIIYAGYLWMTSEGSEEKIETAKKILKNAAIGLLIVFSAFAIVSFILNKLLGTGGGGGGSDADAINYFDSGIGALGNGIIRSVYPEPNQKDVPRNTGIIVTFREDMKADTLCQDVDSSHSCNNEPIASSSIKIFKTDEEKTCLSATSPTCSSLVGAKITSKDSRTFVIYPAGYLGSPSEKIWYSVYLSKDVKKADGKDAFTTFKVGFEWRFEVSSKLDLDPPQVINGGVFPAPDNEKDEVGITSGAIAATGKIKIVSTPQIYTSRSVGIPSPDTVAVQGNYSCQSDGMISVSINDSNKVVASGVEGVVGGDDAGDGKASIGCGLTLTGNLSAGNFWSFSVVSEKQADTVTAGSNIYTASNAESNNTFKVGGTADTAASLAKIINNTNSKVSASVSADEIVLTVKVAGKDGNNINLTSSNASKVLITGMSGGKDKEKTSVVKGKRDKPMNSAIQINFNEAINPLTVSGKSSEVGNFIRIVNASSSVLNENSACIFDNQCKSYKCDAASKKCIGNYLAGKFEISNQYATVEFISDNECGVNACGEKIYCLPSDSNLKVEVVAASLASCGGNDECVSKNPYGSCNDFKGSKVCQNIASTTNPINYPLSAPILDGIADMCLNSLDGNRNANAEGPSSIFYNENAPDSANGDSYKWSFFINDIIDLTAPKIISTRQKNKSGAKADTGSGMSLYNPIIVDFDKLMLSSSLSTGQVVINNGKEDVRHQLINVWNFTGQPLGYWTSNSGIDLAPQDGEPDKTEAFIEHTDFTDSTKYRAQAGSGIKDIYQNCYKPCSGGSCAGGPSCCTGNPVSAEKCQ